MLQISTSNPLVEYVLVNGPGVVDNAFNSSTRLHWLQAQEHHAKMVRPLRKTPSLLV